MDKIKAALAWLKRNHFWVLAVLGVIVTMTVWSFATSTLSKIYVENKTKVEGEFSRVGTIMTADDLKNEKINKVLDDQLLAVGQDVLDAWKLQYDAQLKVLTWPKVLGAEFNATMQKLPLTEDIPRDYRDRYAEVIAGSEFPELVKVGQAKHFLDQKKEEEGGGRRADPILSWAAANQSNIYDKLKWDKKVSTREVRSAQEDIWAYRAILGILAKVNAGATGHYNAKVRALETMEVGPPGGVAFVNMLVPGRLVLPDDAPLTNTPVPLPDVAPGEGVVIPTLDARRYADEFGRPLPDASPLPIERRRLPVHFTVVMNQQEISLLLAECARATLPIEVRQVRLNPGTIKGGSRPPAAGGQGLTLGERQRQSTEEKDKMDRGPFDMTVDVLGFIYLYNPPDRAKLGLPATGPQTAGTSSDDAAPAVAATPSS